MYFDKRRGIANAILVAGGSLGGLILPPVYRILLDTYGLRGALLITGGFLSNCIVGGILLRPLTFHNKPRKCCIVQGNQHVENILKNDKSVYTGSLQSDTCTKSGLSNKDNVQNSSRFIFIESPKSEMSLPNLILDKYEDNCHQTECGSPLLYHKYRQRSVSTNDHVTLNSRPSFSSSLSCISQLQADADKESNENVNDIQKTSLLDYLNINTNSLEHIFVRIVLVVYSIGSIGCSYGMMYVTTFAQDSDIDSLKAATLTSIVSACDCIGRISHGLIADRNYIRKTNQMALSMIFAGIMLLVAPVFTSFWHFVIFVILYGISSGGVFVLTPVILMDFMGMDEARSTLGIMVFCQGIAMTSAAPFIGEDLCITNTR